MRGVNALMIPLAALAVHGADFRACVSENEFSLGEHAPKPDLAIRLFDLNTRPEMPMRVMEELRVYLAQQFQKELAASKYFGKVFIVAEDEQSTADFTLKGAFTHARLGANSFSLVNLLTGGAFDDASGVSVVAAIMAAGTEEPVTVFQCELQCCSTPRGVGGGTPGGKAKKTIVAMARHLKATYARMLKDRR